MQYKNKQISVEHKFDSFCKRLLKNEMRDYYRSLKKQRVHEISLSSLSSHELEQLSICPQYFITPVMIDMLGISVNIQDQTIVEILQLIPSDKKDIILMHYFLDMSDQEIATLLHTIKQTIQYRRKASLKILKKFMEELNDE